MQKRFFHSMRISLSLCIVLFFMTACAGYVVQGSKADTHESVLGHGEKTIAITKVEQSSLIPWLPYNLRTALYTEMQLRGYAKWVEPEIADYTMEANISSFETSASISGENDETLLNVVSARLIVKVYDRQHKLVWTSGSIAYSELYQNINEDEAIDEILQELVNIVYNRMQYTF